MRTARLSGYIVIMCHGKNATCENHATEWDHIRSSYLCASCKEFYNSLPKQWSTRVDTP